MREKERERERTRGEREQWERETDRQTDRERGGGTRRDLLFFLRNHECFYYTRLELSTSLWEEQ